jgi:hypothetical protein
MPTTFTDGTVLTGPALTAALAQATADATGAVSSVAGRTGAITLAVADVSGAYPSANPASYITGASPVLTGTPTAPTASLGTSTTQLATTAFVAAAVVASTTGVATFNTRSGAITLTSGDVTGALSFVPYNATNPTGYQTAAQVLATAKNGTTTNDNASAGQIGEYISSTVLVGAAVSLTNNTPANVTSISLSAGDWDVTATIADIPAGSTVVSTLIAAISTASATLGASPLSGGYVSDANTRPTGFAVTIPVGTRRLSLASATTVYLVAQSGFTVSTSAAYGFIGARRAR